MLSSCVLPLTWGTEVGPDSAPGFGKGAPWPRVTHLEKFLAVTDHMGQSLGGSHVLTQVPGAWPATQAAFALDPGRKDREERMAQGHKIRWLTCWFPSFLEATCRPERKTTRRP